MSSFIFVPVKLLKAGINLPLRRVKDPMMYSALENVGVICLSVMGFQAVRVIAVGIYKHVLEPLARKMNLRDMDPWAVVTGSTDGLGKAYAEALAKHGVNIVLISCNKTKLEAQATRLKTVYHIETKVINVDLTDDWVENYRKLEETLWPMEIGILINNVGLSNPHPAYFLDLPNSEAIYSNILKWNLTAMTNVTQSVLPLMVQRRKGIVLNMSSTAAVIPSPLLAVYGESKAYVVKFTKDMASEYSRHGIFIECFMPGFVATNMTQLNLPSWMAPTPDQYVKDALRTIGIQHETRGCFPQSLMVGAIHCIQSFAPTFMTWVITSRARANSSS